jgi:hypothetical protein
VSCKRVRKRKSTVCPGDASIRVHLVKGPAGVGLQLTNDSLKCTRHAHIDRDNWTPSQPTKTTKMTAGLNNPTSRTPWCRADPKRGVGMQDASKQNQNGWDSPVAKPSAFTREHAQLDVCEGHLRKGAGKGIAQGPMRYPSIGGKKGVVVPN